MTTINLLDDVTAFLGPDKFEHLAGPHGERPDAITRAAKMGLPSLIDGIRVLGSTEVGSSRVMDIIRTNHYDEPDALGHIDTMLDDPSGRTRLSQNGRGLLGSVFGDRLEGIVDSLSNRAGVAHTSMERLLGLLAPVVFGVLGKKVREGGLDDRSLSTLLGSQRPPVSELMSDGVTKAVAKDDLCMPKMFDRPEPVVAAPPSAPPVHAAAPVRPAPIRATSSYVERPTAATSRSSRGFNWMWPLLGLALLATLLFFVFRGFGEREREHTAAVRETHERVAPPAKPEEPRIAPGEAETQTGIIEPETQNERIVPETQTGTLEPEMQTTPAQTSGIDGFTSALESDSDVLPASFVLDELRFEHGSADVQSNATVDRVAELLRDHPTARVRIDGHTDMTGDPQRNIELSQERADAIRTALIERGVDESRIETMGHGADAPIASDETGEGRRQNRRTEITLLSR